MGHRQSQIRDEERETSMPNRRVAIVGVSTSDCGRVDDKTAFELNFQGTTRALADAGIAKSEVDGFMSLTGALPPVELAEYLGLRPNWVDSTGHGGSIWEFMVEHAAAAIAQGLVEVVVLTYGSTQRADLKKKEGDEFSLARFHDDFLKQGFPPIKIVRRALLGDTSPTL